LRKGRKSELSWLSCYPPISSNDYYESQTPATVISRIPTFHSGHMARLSKTTPFQIHSDNGHATSEAARHSGSDETVDEQERPEQPFAWSGGRKDDGFVTESDDERKGMNDDGAQEGDDEKNYTRTSISSFPESSYPTDYERTPIHKPYTPTYARPSSRRMQMSSPLRKGKFGTPYSEPRGSPRSRRKDFDADNDNHEPKPFPLILLHITTLPVKISWSYQSMREILPQHVLENLQLLKFKLSDTVLKRGILIPHPRDDYEVLEEKLLEALELQEPRISKCGHFRNRHSTDSDLTTASSGADSGVGSSVDGSDEEHCSTCHHHLLAAGSGKQKWSIKVYAANGLMRASAWSAAWSEMERVDVEIMPWFKDDLRIKLDEMNTQEIVVKDVNHKADELRINQLVEERIKLMEEDSERAREAEMSREIERIVIDEQRQFSQSAQEAPMEQTKPAKPAEDVPASQPTSTELPNIYRPKDIPLSILLWNYVFLLAKKPKNMAVFFLVVLVSGLLLAVEPATISSGIAEVSSVVMSKTANMGLVQDVPVVSVLDDAVSDVVEASAQIQTEFKSVLEAVTEAHDYDTVTVSDSALETEDDILGSTQVHDPERLQASSEQLDVDQLAEPETLREEEVESGDIVDENEAIQLEAPEEAISSASISAFEQTDRVTVESVQAEADEDSLSVNQSKDVELKAEISLALEVLEIEIEMDSTLTSESDDKFVAPFSPQVDPLNKCLSYSIISGYPVCRLDEEHDDSSLLVTPMDKCLPYSIISVDSANCKID
jgi:hypothetical protein